MGRGVIKSERQMLIRTGSLLCVLCIFFFQAEDGIRDYKVTGVQTCALPIFAAPMRNEFAAMRSTALSLCGTPSNISRRRFALMEKTTRSIAYRPRMKLLFVPDRKSVV